MNEQQSILDEITPERRVALLAEALHAVAWELVQPETSDRGISEEDYRDALERAKVILPRLMPTVPQITIGHVGGNTVTGSPEQVLNHGHLKPGWAYQSMGLATAAESEGELAMLRAGLTVAREVIYKSLEVLSESLSLDHAVRAARILDTFDHGRYKVSPAEGDF